MLRLIGSARGAKGIKYYLCARPVRCFVGEGEVFQVYRLFGRGRMSDSRLSALERMRTGNGEVEEVRGAQCKSVAKV